MSNIDTEISLWIRETFPTEKIRKHLSRWNRGEVFFILILPVLWFSEGFRPFFLALLYVAIIAFINDRFVLFVKKLVSRKRPLLSVAGKVDSNPDMKHSFPSAHSANSLTVVMILVFAFGVHPWIFVFTVISGIGRLLSLHHFLSDVLGGWIVGLISGSLGVLLYQYFIKPLLI